MNEKKFIACMYLHQKHVVAGEEDLTEVSWNPVELAKSYRDKKCDGILVCDLSQTDREKEEALDIIKEICETVEIPVMGCGGIHRMEDVKKLLYAGCSQAVLDCRSGCNPELTEEVSLKFGKEKIYAMVDYPAQLDEKLAEEFLSGIFLTNSAAAKEAAAVSPVSVFCFMPEISLDKLLDILQTENIAGISGPLVMENLNELHALKKICRENGIPMAGEEAVYEWKDFKLGADGLVPVVVQDDKTEAVLMVAYMNQEAYEKTIETGRMTYYSRSREELWVKGETSGHFQYVRSLTADCDMDTILARVVQVGPACHTGSYSCFFHDIQNRKNGEAKEHNPLKVFEEVFATIQDRKVNPKEGSYTNYLFDKGIDKILKKLGEEATEIVIAAKNPNPNEIKYEIADFLYHMMVLMAEKGISWEEITSELARR